MLKRLRSEDGSIHTVLIYVMLVTVTALIISVAAFVNTMTAYTEKVNANAMSAMRGSVAKLVEELNARGVTVLAGFPDQVIQEISTHERRDTSVRTWVDRFDHVEHSGIITVTLKAESMKKPRWVRTGRVEVKLAGITNLSEQDTNERNVWEYGNANTPGESVMVALWQPGELKLFASGKPKHASTPITPPTTPASSTMTMSKAEELVRKIGRTALAQGWLDVPRASSPAAPRTWADYGLAEVTTLPAGWGIEYEMNRDYGWFVIISSPDKQAIGMFETNGAGTSIPAGQHVGTITQNACFPTETCANGGDYGAALNGIGNGFSWLEHALIMGWM